MRHPLRRLGRSALVGLAEALAAGRVSAPCLPSALSPWVPLEHRGAVATALAEMHTDGMAPRHMARAIQLLAEERAAGQRLSDRVQLVWSPPELDQVDARDTGVVVQDLFRTAQTSVLVASYALDEGRKAVALFGALAERMDALPSLAVRVFVNVPRRYLDDTPTAQLLRSFAKRLREHVWPGERLPEVFYDPRSLEPEGSERACLHAKCVVVDGRFALLTSANFTEAAQERNIEAGVLLDDRRFAARMTRQFDMLVASHALRRLPP